MGWDGGGKTGERLNPIILLLEVRGSQVYYSNEFFCCFQFLANFKLKLTLQRAFISKKKRAGFCLFPHALPLAKSFARSRWSMRLLSRGFPVIVHVVLILVAFNKAFFRKLLNCSIQLVLIHSWAKSVNYVAISIYQELIKVPINFRALRTFCMLRCWGMRPKPCEKRIKVDVRKLVHHFESNAMTSRIADDVLIAAWLLVAKVIARESKDLETSGFVS